MKHTVLKSVIGAAAALFFVCGMTFAKTSNISVMYRAELGHHLTLAPGHYKMSVSTLSGTHRAAFFQNGKLVGTAPVKVVSEAKKNDQTMVFFSAPHNDLRNITQIDVSGWRNKLLFSKSHASID
ncbi:MAG: hypothetical protein ACRD3O_03290 [Terriglobia bacterium]